MVNRNYLRNQKAYHKALVNIRKKYHKFINEEYSTRRQERPNLARILDLMDKEVKRSSDIISGKMTSSEDRIYDLYLLLSSVKKERNTYMGHQMDVIHYTGAVKECLEFLIEYCKTQINMLEGHTGRDTDEYHLNSRVRTNNKAALGKRIANDIKIKEFMSNVQMDTGMRRPLNYGHFRQTKNSSNNRHRNLYSRRNHYPYSPYHRYSPYNPFHYRTRPRRNLIKNRRDRIYDTDRYYYPYSGNLGIGIQEVGYSNSPFQPAYRDPIFDFFGRGFFSRDIAMPSSLFIIDKPQMARFDSQYFVKPPINDHEREDREQYNTYTADYWKTYFDSSKSHGTTYYTLKMKSVDNKCYTSLRIGLKDSKLEEEMQEDNSRDLRKDEYEEMERIFDAFRSKVKDLHAKKGHSIG